MAVYPSTGSKCGQSVYRVPLAANTPMQHDLTTVYRVEVDCPHHQLSSSLYGFQIVLAASDQQICDPEALSHLHGAASVALNVSTTCTWFICGIPLYSFF
jgi:hypothetical protein